MNSEIVISKACFSGYRSDKFRFKLNKNDERYNALISSLNTVLKNLIDNGCNCFYCGMADGFDIIAAECVLKLKANSQIRLVCAVPFLEHSASIKSSWQKRYNNVISKSDEIVYTDTAYSIYSYQIRNKYMVDHSDCVVVWYDGKKGGTRNTLLYAAKKGKKIINVNSDFDTDYLTAQTLIDL